MARREGGDAREMAFVLRLEKPFSFGFLELATFLNAGLLRLEMLRWVSETACGRPVESSGAPTPKAQWAGFVALTT